MLEPLSSSSAEALLEDFLGSTAEMRPLTRMLVERTGGNALFLEESVRTLIENEVLVGDHGAYRLAKPLASIQIPDRVQAVLAARIDRLPEDRKSFLQAGAVIGEDLPVALLQAVADVSSDEVLGNLAELEEAQFLKTTSLYPDLAYSFRHALTHDVVYASMLKDQRRNLHARIVDALEALYSRAARRARRAPGLPRARRRAVVRGGRLSARGGGQGRRALGQPGGGGVPGAGTGSAGAPAGVARDVRAGHRRPADLRPPLLQLGRLEEIRSLSEEAARMAEQIGDEVRQARAYAYLINYHYLRGEPARALEYGERCLAIAERLGDRILASVARRYMGHAYHALGQARHAIKVLQDNADALAADVDREPSAAAVTAYVSTCAWLAFAQADLGEFDSAETWADRARAEAEAWRHPYSEAIALTFAGQVAALRGQLERAVGPLARALTICRETSLTVWQAIPGGPARPLPGGARPQAGRAVAPRGGRARCPTRSASRPTWPAGPRCSVRASWRWATRHAAAEIGERAIELARTHGERGHEAAALRLLGDLALAHEPPLVGTATEHYRRRPSPSPTSSACGRSWPAPIWRSASSSVAPAARSTPRATSPPRWCFLDLGMRSWLDRSEPERARSVIW